MQAIETSPFYNDTFKKFEKARLTPGYLRRLHEIDPAHVMIITDRNEPVGFVLSGPEYGALWLYWTFVLPERRRSPAGVSALRDFVAYWDNGRFHKIATYTKPGNRVAKAIMKRQGFQLVCTLEKHMFGEDYLLYERRLNKVQPGYDLGMSGSGLRGRLLRMARRLLG